MLIRVKARDFMDGTPVEDAAFVSGPRARPQADSQSAEAASTHVTPVRPNI